MSVYVCFYNLAPGTERTGRGAKKHIIQSCHSPPEIWISVFCLLNMSYLGIAGELPIFLLFQDTDKRARNSASNCSSLFWQQTDYKFPPNRLLKSKAAHNAVEKPLQLGLREQKRGRKVGVRG